MCAHDLSLTFLLLMADWTFDDVLTTIKSPPSIPTSVLESPDGLCLGYICFAKIHTTLQMCSVSLALLEKLVTDECFNPEHKPHGDYSHSTVILLVFTQDTQLKDIESVGIGLVVCQHGAPLAPISAMSKVILYICDTLKFERVSSTPQVRTYCMILGNYSGHMACATELPFCMAYPLKIVDKKDSAVMIFRNPDNHPVTFMGMEMVICQLLMWDCSEHKYERTNCNGCLIIPRGVQFGKELFPEIRTMLYHTVTPLQERRLLS